MNCGQVNLSHILIASIGLHFLHFLMTYQLHMRRAEGIGGFNRDIPFIVRYQEITLKKTIHFLFATVLLWSLCGWVAIPLAVVASTARVLVVYWCFNDATIAGRTFWYRSGLNVLFYNSLYTGLTFAAASIGQHINQ